MVRFNQIWIYLYYILVLQFTDLPFHCTTFNPIEQFVTSIFIDWIIKRMSEWMDQFIGKIVYNRLWQTCIDHIESVYYLIIRHSGILLFLFFTSVFNETSLRIEIGFHCIGNETFQFWTFWPNLYWHPTSLSTSSITSHSCHVCVTVHISVIYVVT